jgi:ketosteroid isomerase-like protein
VPSPNLTAVVDAFAQDRVQFAPLSPEVELVAFPGVGEAGSYRGPEDVERYFLAFRAPFADDWSMRVVRSHDLGDRVAVKVRGRASGRQSGVPVEATWSQAYWFAGGLIERIEVHPRFADAVAAIERDVR